jgi:FtsP/CotA-like multicopper oxidase with cupredoxin domain
MRGAPEMDGVIGVTQCGLRPGAAMEYRFVVDNHPGTHW